MKRLSAVVLSTQSDEKLVAMASSGSHAAFEAIVHRYRRPLYAYCRRLLAYDARCEDIVQQALLNAWQALESGVEVRQPRAWLYRIVRNQALRAYQRPEPHLDALVPVTDVADPVDAELQRRMLVSETFAAVAKLPELQREALVRTAIDGQSYEQVAIALGLSDDAVRGLLQRARRSLRAAVAAVGSVVWAAEDRHPSGLLKILGDVPRTSPGLGASSAIVAKGAAVVAVSAATVVGAGAVIARGPAHPPPAPPTPVAALVAPRSADPFSRRQDVSRAGAPRVDPDARVHDLATALDLAAAGEATGQGEHEEPSPGLLAVAEDVMPRGEHDAIVSPLPPPSPQTADDAEASGDPQPLAVQADRELRLTVRTVDRRAPNARRRRRLRRLAAAVGQRLKDPEQRAEEAFDERFSRRYLVTDTNLVAVVSPKGGPGKTTIAVTIGDALAGRLPNQRIGAIAARSVRGRSCVTTATGRATEVVGTASTLCGGSSTRQLTTRLSATSAQRREPRPGTARGT